MLYKTIHGKNLTIQNQQVNVIQIQLSLGQSNLIILLNSFPKDHQMADNVHQLLDSIFKASPPQLHQGFVDRQ
jgi:hypothetical protein